MKSVQRILAATLFCAGAGQALAADGNVPVVAGGNPDTLSGNVSTLVPLCASCHGADGISAVGLYPNLAGQKVEYLVKQLLAFKTRERSDPVMNSMAEPLSEEAIRQLAQYFSSRK
ncbi:c-type cytochrome [Achromobacter marplatensis]|uniref:c-type cytochrome n=1 Tax=Achromobacter marplatensis TaxID=470868 RepID=UPI0039F70B5F